MHCIHIFPGFLRCRLGFLFIKRYIYARTLNFYHSFHLCRSTDVQSDFSRLRHILPDSGRIWNYVDLKYTDTLTVTSISTFALAAKQSNAEITYGSATLASGSIAKERRER